MQVRAIYRGFHEGVLRHPGTVFEMDRPAHRLPRWVQPAEAHYTPYMSPEEVSPPFDTKPLEARKAAAIKMGERFYADQDGPSPAA
jgi:hypothetical protein